MSNKFEKVGNLIKWHSIKLPANTTEPFSQSLMDFVVLDSVLKKFSSESLVLLGRPNMEVHLDYFNRVSHNMYNKLIFMVVYIFFILIIVNKELLIA